MKTDDGQSGASPCVAGRVGAAVRGLRRALAELFHDAGVDLQRIRATARDLGINRGLAWRISRVVTETDLAVAASQVPGRASIERLIDACRARGASQTAIERVDIAIEAFEEAVADASGNRRGAATILASEDPRSSPRHMEADRRKLFEGARSVWGVEAKATLRISILAPSDGAPGWADLAGVRATVGLQRLRPISWAVGYRRLYSTDVNEEDLSVVPLDPQAADDALPLLRSYCSPSDLEITESTAHDCVRYELPPGPLGKQGEATCVVGTRSMKAYPTPSDGPAAWMTLVQTPMESITVDLFVHRSIAPIDTPDMFLCDRLGAPHGYHPDRVHADALHHPGIVEPIDERNEDAVLGRIPWYGRLLKETYATCGWRASDFIGYRFHMAYPPVATALIMQTQLTATGDEC